MSAKLLDVGDSLKGLKDFQGRTVDYVFDRMYGDSKPARRFLIADEVGLGKTLGCAWDRRQGSRKTPEER